MTTVYKFKAYYTDAGVGTAQDPAPTCTVINMADDSKLADAQATTASTNMPGLYSYEYSGNDGLDCVAWFKTTDTGCDVKQLASYVSEKITTNLNADVAGVETKLDTVDANVDAILADTGTDGVVLKAAGLNADAVAEIQSGLALESTLTAIKGAGWSTETLVAIQAHVLAGFAGEDLNSVLNQLYDIKGTGWTNQTLAKIVTDIAAISAGSGATAQEVWEYATRVLTAGTNIDLSSLATATDLATVDTVVDAIKAKTDNLPADPAAVGSAMILTAAYDKAKDDVLTPLAVVDSIVDGLKTTLDNIHDTDLPAVKTETAAIKAKTDLIPASPAEAGEYTAAIAAVKSVADDILVDTGTTLDALIKDIPTNAELATALGTADDAVLAAVAAAKSVIDNIHDTDLPAVKAETALIVEDTGTTIPALLETIDNFLDTEVAAILEDTDTTLPATLATIAGYTDGIAGDVWSHPHRTLTNQGIDATSPAVGDPLIIYRDSTVGISLTGLADSTNSTKMWFTVKENLEDADASSILQILFTHATPHTDTLLYVNKAAPISADNGSFVVADHTDGTASITLAAAEAANLPIYAATPLYWDVKMLTAAGVTILSTGTMYIYGTPTRTIS